MADIRITCIVKSIPNGGYQHITHAGNSSGNWTVPTIVYWIENRVHTFHVVDDRTGKRAEVGVVKDAGKAPYIRTHADGYYNDNLLSLVACPWKAAA